MHLSSQVNNMAHLSPRGTSRRLGRFCLSSEGAVRFIALARDSSVSIIF